MESEEGAEQYLAWLEKEYFSATATDNLVRSEETLEERQPVPFSLHLPVIGHPWPMMVTLNSQYFRDLYATLGCAVAFVGGVLAIPVVWRGFMWFVNGQ